MLAFEAFPLFTIFLPLQYKDMGLSFPVRCSASNSRGGGGAYAGGAELLGSGTGSPAVAKGGFTCNDRCRIP